MRATIYHNPQCGTSRKVLAILQEAGVALQIVDYLKTPLTKDALRTLIRQTGQPVRAILRQKGTPFDELGLSDERLSEGQLLDCMVQHPILMNRPIVVTDIGAALCRPSDKVLELLADCAPTCDSDHKL